MIDRTFLRFAVKLVIYFVLLHLLCLVPWIDRAFVEPWTALNARWAAGLMSLLEEGYVASGTMIRAGGQWVNVELGCNGVDAFALCAGAVLAFPARPMRKLLGVAVAAVGVFGLNVVRLANLAFVARHFPDHLELFHVYIWQTLIALLALGIFLLWGRFVAGGFGARGAAVSR